MNTKDISITKRVLFQVVCCCIALLLLGVTYVFGVRNGRDEFIEQYVERVVSTAVTDPQNKHLEAGAAGAGDVVFQYQPANCVITFHSSVINEEGDQVGTARGTLGPFAAQSTLEVQYSAQGKCVFTSRYFGDLSAAGGPLYVGQWTPKS